MNENVVPEGVEINGFKMGVVIDVLSVGFTTDVVLTWNLECLQTFRFFARKKNNIFLRALQHFFARCNTVPPPQPIALVPLNRRFSVLSLLFGIGVVADLSSVAGKSVW